MRVLPLALILLVPPQAAPLPALTADETKAAATITVDRVRDAVRFLASDDLAGRDTSSPGLAKAGDWVAERLRAAGLEGLGKDGSFFLPAIVEAPPTEGIAFGDESGQPLPHAGLLWANREPFRFKGTVAMLEGGAWPTGLNGPILAEEPPAGRGSGRLPPPLVAMLRVRDLARTGKRQGATAILLHIAEDSPLRNLEQTRTTRRLAEQMDLPVLLVLEAPRGAVQLRIPGRTRTAGEDRNVCGVLRGRDPKLRDEALLISAHLDHIGTRPGEGDTIFNGADDDASGCTGVVALAEAYAALPRRPKRSIVFVTFWGEEKGLLGSRDFASNPGWPLERIVANVNLEMIGRPEPGATDKVWMTGWTQSDLGEIVAEGAARAGIEVFRHPRLSAMLYRSSDNWSFVEKGVIAHSFSAGSLHADYHRVSDEWEKLDLEHMTKVIQGMFAGCLPIAEGLRTPAKRKD